MVPPPGCRTPARLDRHAPGRAWAWTLVLLLAGALAAAPARAAVDDLPRRLVIGLDGVSFDDMFAAQSAGAFARFQPVHRLISTFPSISDIAWSEIFQTGPPLGYQRVYVDLDTGRLIGGGLDPLRPIAFERRMHLGFDAMTHHVSSYVTPGRAARSELERLERAVFESRGIETFFAYLPAPDALQHVRGDVRRYLRVLDTTLRRLSDAYLERTGVPLDIVLLSDHGHNGVRRARTVDLAGHLRSHGYEVAHRLAGPRDVVFSTDGVSTGVGVFVAPPEAPRLAAVLATLAGIELVTWLDETDPAATRVRDTDGHIARVVQRADGALAYEMAYGDPLGYGPVIAVLCERGQLDGDGFARPEHWLDATLDHQYPNALERIVRGHRDVTRNPAPILLSIEDGYQVANGMVATLSKFRPTGGTHGGLNARNSLGIVMSTFQPTVDAPTHRVADQFGGFALGAVTASR